MMFGWSELKQEIKWPPVDPPRPPPPPLPKDPPPVARAQESLADKMSNALGVLFGGKPKKLPHPIPCGGCGGLIWT